MKKSVLLGLMILFTLKSIHSFTQSNIFPASGNVGIGTTTPVSPLTIKGSYSSPQTLISYDGSNSIFFHAQNGSTHPNWYIGQLRATTRIELTLSSTVGGTIFSTPAMILKNNGNEGIGTTNPQNKLDVNGTIHAKEFKASLDGWFDFVFDEDYKLSSIKDVENYLKTNKHLQDIILQRKYHIQA